MVCKSDEAALWLCIQGPKIPIGNGRLYIKPAQPRGSRNLKEAQDAEELRHRDFGPTDGLNTAQLDMLKHQMLKTSGETAIRECKKMQEHLELVAKGAAGMSPQHSSLYNSLSERMVKAERRITDVESNQNQHHLELAQLRQQMAQLHVKSTATEARLAKFQVDSVAEKKKFNEVQKQVKLIALNGGLLTSDSMNVPHTEEIHRDNDGEYDDGVSPSIMPPYNLNSDMDLDVLAATQDVHNGQMLNTGLPQHQSKGRQPQHQQQQYHQPDHQQYTQQQHQPQHQQQQPHSHQHQQQTLPPILVSAMPNQQRREQRDRHLAAFRQHQAPPEPEKRSTSKPVLGN